MHIRKRWLAAHRHLQATEATEGYVVQLYQVPSAQGPKVLATDDCSSGDWAGMVTCDRGRLRVVLADVEDKGRGVRRYHEALARHLPASGAATQWLAELDANWPGPRFASVGVVEVDTERHEFQATLAGHPDPVLRWPGGAVRVLAECRLGLVGLNLGTVEAEPVAHSFPNGACLVLVSDGVLDAGVVTCGEAFGVERLLTSVASARSASQVACQILEAVSQHLGGAEPEDDATVVVIIRTVAAAAPAVEVVRPAA